MTRRVGSARRLVSGAGGEDGRVSVFLAVAFTAAILLIGLSVDGAARLRLTQRADNLAAEAARAAGQALDGPTAVTGGVKRVDPAGAAAAATAYLDAAGAPGTADIAPDRRSITVTVTLWQDTTMLTVLGIDEITATGQATATLVTG